MKTTGFSALSKMFFPLLAAAILQTLPLVACAEDAGEKKLFREIYRELVEINTTDSVGDTTQAARAMAARLKAGGFADADMQAARRLRLICRSDQAS